MWISKLVTWSQNSVFMLQADEKLWYCWVFLWWAKEWWLLSTIHDV